MNWKFEGGRELTAALRQLSDQTGKTTQGKAAMRRTLTIAGKITQNVAQLLAPVLTGALQISISVGTKLTRRQARMARKLGKSAVEVHVGTANPAGIPQEFGTFKESAQPFMGPAWDATQRQVLDKIETEAWNQIRKTAQRVARKAAKFR